MSRPLIGPVQSSLQPWLDAALQGSQFTSLPQLQPCISSNGSNVACSEICRGERDFSEILYDTTKPVNLINCGLWRTAAYSLALGGDFKASGYNMIMLRCFSRLDLIFL